MPKRTSNALAAFFLLFGVMGSYALLETARDALFLAQLPATKLPWAYLATALIAPLTAWLAQPALRHASRARTAMVILVSAIWMLGLYLVSTHSSRPAYLLYVSVGVVGTIVIVQAWTLIGTRFTIVDARRLFALIAGGGALGAIAGCALAARVVSQHGPRSLIAIAAATLVMTSAIPFLLRPDHSPSRQARRDSGTPLREMYRTAYARRIFWVVALTAVATTAADFLFKSSVATHVSVAGLGSFFATFQLAMNIIGLAMQVMVAPLLLRRFGANRMVVALPMLIAGTAAAFALVPGIAAGLLMKGVDGALRNSIHRTSTEVLYLPLPVQVRGRAKGLIDAAGQRGAQAFASLLVLGGLAVGATSVHIALGVAVAAAACVVIAVRLNRHYVQTFREQLRDGGLTDQVSLPQLDLQSVESLLSMLSSPNDVRVLAALDTLVAQGKTKLIPSLLLYHPSAVVASRTLEILAVSGRKDFLPLTERLLAASDSDLVAAASRVRAGLIGDKEELRQLASDVRIQVRAPGLIGLARLGAATPADWKRIQRIAGHGPRAERMLLLAAIAQFPHASLVPVLDELAQGGDIAVQTGVVSALQACGDPRCLPIALRLLGQRATREAARKVLVEAGAAGLDLLAHALLDASVASAVRRHIPRTLSRFASDRAATVLLEALDRPGLDAVTRYKVLRGLGRMKRNQPALRLDRKALHRLAHRAVERTTLLRRWRAALGRVSPTPSSLLLQALLGRKERRAVERLFRVLDLLRPGGEMERIHDGLRHPDSGKRAISRELLENLVSPDLRSEVLGVVDEDLAPAGATALTETLRAMREDRSSAVRALADEYATELGLEERRHAS